MKRIRLVIALLLAVPLTAFAANLVPPEAGAAPGAAVVEDASGSDYCCWVIVWGRLICVPC